MSHRVYKYIWDPLLASDSDVSRFAIVQIHLVGSEPTLYTVDNGLYQSAIINWNYNTGSFDIIIKKKIPKIYNNIRKFIKKTSNLKGPRTDPWETQEWTAVGN